ncbi:uncharacterized protein LOC116416137 [Nasonia vitripennis]|uniref:F-box/LRR-repeat protein 15-like leucin rich repeat domain-containing protein n=1 Tax=Nasonia vitripennis TaxID=7425 RepID=A0A7M7Q2Z7_NASVI|nr:uncharacterized protein LOC116416137 [Nasonia vitripennis]
MLVNCRKLTLDNFHVIRGFRNLKQLTLEEFYFENGFTEDISSCYKSLKYLTLAYGYTESLHQIAKLINLRTLDLSNEPVDEELLVSIGANCKLLKVDISDCSRVTNTGLASIVSLPDLESLCIQHLINIDDQVFCAMSTLRQLDCNYCTNMRDAGLIKLIERSENLEHLFLENCDYISKELLEAAVKATKKRKNQVMLKLHLRDKNIRRLKASVISPFLPIFETIIDQSEGFYYSGLQSFVGSYPFIEVQKFTSP